MAIKELITLEGVEQVKKSLDDLGKSGEQFLSQVRESTAGAADPLKSFSTELNNTTTSVNSTNSAISGFRDGLHILHPVLQAAGVQVGEFTGFSRAASAGILGLGAAVVGTAIVALFRLSETIAEVKQRLNDIFQSNAAGQKAFDDLSASASKFGTTVQSIAPGFEGFLRAFETFQQRNATFKFVALDPADLPQLKDVKAAYDALFAALRAGGASEDNAKKAIAEFNTEMKKTGQVTGEALDKLLAVAPGALTQLEAATGKAKTTQAAFVQELDKAPQTFGKFIEGLARIRPAAETAFDARPIKSFSENITASFAIIENAIQSFVDSAERAGKTAPTTIAPVFSELTADATGSLDQIKELFSKNPFDFSEWTAAFSSFFETLGPIVSSTFSQLFASIPVPDFSSVVNSFQQAMQQLVSIAQSVWDQIQSIFSSQIQIQTSSGSTGGPLFSGFARGGLVRGAGTTTSDSIWARLSDKEFVLNAKATQFYGAELLYALNALRVPRQFPGFSMGGLVNAMANAMPKFATGGTAATGSPVTIVIDSQRFNMTAPADTVKALSRFSVVRQLSATGRKPSWVK